jgi:Flp pilus assembly protein TadD
MICVPAPYCLPKNATGACLFSLKSYTTVLAVNILTQILMSDLTAKYDACVELQRAGKNEEAFDAFVKLTQEHPDFSLPYNALAAIYKKNGELSKAIQSIEKYCELEPNDAFGFSILSSYYIADGNHQGAEDALAKVSELRFKEQFEDNN